MPAALLPWQAGQGRLSCFCNGGREIIVSLWCCHGAWAARKVVRVGNLCSAFAFLNVKKKKKKENQKLLAALQATEDASV